MPVKAGVIRAGARTTRRGAAETFTGVVFQDPVITAEAPSRLGGSVVTFTPGARTAWHSRSGRRSSVYPASAASASRGRSRKC
jgi:quercetin dioxygenase-like cupin family protein